MRPAKLPILGLGNADHQDTPSRKVEMPTPENNADKERYKRIWMPSIDKGQSNSQEIAPYHFRSGKVHHIFDECRATEGIPEDRRVAGDARRRLCAFCSRIINYQLSQATETDRYNVIVQDDRNTFVVLETRML